MAEAEALRLSFSAVHLTKKANFYPLSWDFFFRLLVSGHIFQEQGRNAIYSSSCCQKAGEISRCWV